MEESNWNERDHPRDKNHQKFVKKGTSGQNENSHLTKTAFRDTLKEQSVVMLPKRLYAEFDSIIRTKYANKIPRNGFVVCYNPIEGYNDFMVFSYDKKEDRNVCIRRLDMDRDVEEIAIIRRVFTDE